VSKEAAITGLGIRVIVVSACALGRRFWGTSCAVTYRHNTLNMKAVKALMKYEKSNVYIFLIKW